MRRACRVRALCPQAQDVGKGTVRDIYGPEESDEDVRRSPPAGQTDMKHPSLARFAPPRASERRRLLTSCDGGCLRSPTHAPTRTHPGAPAHVLRLPLCLRLRGAPPPSVAPLFPLPTNPPPPFPPASALLAAAAPPPPLPSSHQYGRIDTSSINHQYISHLASSQAMYANMLFCNWSFASPLAQFDLEKGEASMCAACGCVAEDGCITALRASCFGCGRLLRRAGAQK